MVRCLALTLATLLVALAFPAVVHATVTEDVPLASLAQLKTLKLGLLGLALVLVGARLRALARRRAARAKHVTFSAEGGGPESPEGPRHVTPGANVLATATYSEDEPAGIGLPPSTAIAKRQAALRSASHVE